MADIIDGKAIAQEVRAEVRDEVAEWVAEGHEAPGLATVLVGDDAASAVYIGGKQRASAEVVRGGRSVAGCEPAGPEGELQE